MKQILFSIILVFFNFHTFSQFAQLGQDIDGLTYNEGSGFSTALNSDGSIVAVGIPYYSVFAIDAGAVRIYQYDGTYWVQLGQDILTENTKEHFGASISISDDGLRVAIGAPQPYLQGYPEGIVRIYDFDGTDWIQVGQDIVGDALSDQFGGSLSLTGSGNMLVIGANGDQVMGFNTGRVAVYEFDGVNWVQLGNSIYGNQSERFGMSVAFDPAGSKIIAGAPFSDGFTGRTRVYDWNSNINDWVQVGNDIIGNQLNARAGTSVGINNDGEWIAIGAPRDGINNQGSVTTYRYSSGSGWQQFGQTIYGVASSDMAGAVHSIGISTFTDRMVIGSVGHNGNAIQSGHSRIFGFNGSSWVQFGQAISGVGQGDEAASVSISDDGERFSIGAPNHDGVDINIGHVRVYEVGSTGLEENENFQVSIYPNPTQGIIQIESDSEITSIDIFDITGRVVDIYEFNSETHLKQEPGVYLMNLKRDGNILKSARIVVQ